MVFEFIFFIFIIIFTLFIPGNFLLRIVSFPLKNPVINIPVALSVGITVFILGTYFLSYLNESFFYHVILFPVWFGELKRFYLKKNKLSQLPSISFAGLIILSLGTLWMSYLMWNSGKIIEGQLQFFGVNAIDAIWHLSLIGNLSQNFPPTHPGLAGIDLRGYNYFYDFFLSKLHEFYGFTPSDLFFRLMPVFLALLYGLTGFALGAFLKLKKLTQIVFVFLLYFGFGFEQSVSFLLKTFYNPGIVHTSANAVDPSVILSIIFFFTISILLFSATNKKQLLLPALLLGILPMIKIYTAVMCFGGLGIVSIVTLMKKKFRLLVTTLGASALAALLYLPINYGAGSLIYAPFLLYRHFMEGAKFFTEYQWALKYMTYMEDGNNLRIIQLFVIAIGLFFIPSLGIRLAALRLIPDILQKKFYSNSNIFFTSSILIGFIIPSFFIQSIAVFVVLQFLWIAFILLLLPTSVALTKGIDFSHKIKVAVLFLFLLLIALPEMSQLYAHYTFNPYHVSKDLTTSFMKIKENVSEDEAILVVNAVTTKDYPGGKLVYGVPLVSAVTLRSVYYEPEVLEFYKLEKLQAERTQKVLSVHNALSQCNIDEVKRIIKEIKKDSSVSYLFSMTEYKCINNIKWLRNVFSEKNYSLYKIENL